MPVFHLSYNAKRTIAGGLGLSILVAGINVFFDLHWFRGYDKIVLILAVAASALLTAHLRSGMQKKRPTFSWMSLFFAAVLVTGSVAGTWWHAYRRHQSSSYSPQIYIAIGATVLAFFVYRWDVLRGELRNSTFDDDLYHRDPGSYILGQTRGKLIFGGSLFAVMLALALWHVFGP